MKFSRTRLFTLVGLAGIFLAGFGSQGVSTPAVTAKSNKVIIYPSGNETIGQLRQQGIANVDNYGSYWVAEVGDQDLAKLKATHGDRVVVANHLNKIELSTGAIDTRVGEPAVPANLRQSVGTGMRLRLVQFKGPVQPDWLEQVKAAGKVKIVTYIPNNAYLVHLDDAAEQNLNKLMAPSGPIQWIGSYHPYYKMRSSLRDSTAPTVKVHVAVVRGPDTEQTLQNIKRYSLTSMGEPTATRNQVVAEIEVATKDLPQIAQMPDVLWISQAFPMKNMDEEQTLTLTTSEAGPQPATYVDFLANAGFSTDQTTYPILDIADTGLDEPNPNCNNTKCSPPIFVPFVTTFHPSFYEISLTIGEVSSCAVPVSRVAYRDDTDIEGHGTVVASVAAGLDTLPSETVVCITLSNAASTNCVGVTNVLSPPFPDFVLRQFGPFQAGLGVSPYGPIGSSRGGAQGNFLGDFGHAQNIYLRTARISNNSWGQVLQSPPVNAGVYGVASQDYDILTRDSLLTGSTNPPTPGSSPLNQELIWVFAAGNVNDLRGGISDIGGIPDVTVTPPATAKNIISVGAITKGEPEQIAAFSAFGPTEDGRFKPEIVAPGVDIFGAVSQATYTQPQCGGCDPGDPEPPACDPKFALGNTITELYGPPNNVIFLNSGTSFSAPAVAGGVQLMWWWFQNKLNTLQPSPAMAKAYLCNSARYVPLTNSLTGVGDRLPSIAQGMGRMDLTRMFDGVPRVLRDETTPRAIDNALLSTNPIVQQTFFSRSGQSYEVSGVVVSNGAPFRVTLAWTDAPGDPASFKQLVNDLDLQVTIGGQTYKGNVFGTQYSTVDPSRGADTVNNIESVFLPAGTTGPWSVVVRASNIAGEGVPNINNNTGIGQDFALVVYNGGNDAFGGPSAPSDAANLATNNSCQTAANITQFPYSFTNSMTKAVYGNVHPSPSAAHGGVDEFFKIPLPTPGVTFTVDASGDSFDTVLSVWSGDCGALTEVVSTNDVIHGSQVSFTADGSNDYYIVVEPHSDGPGGRVILNVNATQTPISVTPTNLAFGNQIVGTTSAVQQVTYLNGATVNVDILSNPTVTGPNAANFPIISQNCGFDTVRTGATCVVLIAFAPTSLGTNTANLVFTDNATGSPRIVPLSGVGTPVAPLVCLSSGGSLTFSSQLVTTTGAVQSITITNCGSANLTVTNITVTGSGSADFVVTQDCVSGSPIAPGGTCAINVSFAPQAAGTRQATLKVTDNAAGGPTTLLLQGNGIPLTPAICFGSNPLNFGTVFVSTTGAVQSLIITNCGRAPLVISSAIPTGANAGDFLVNSSCGTISPGSTCAIDMTFAPTATGMRTAVLTVNDNTATSPEHISLTGIGSGVNCFSTITVSPSVLPAPTVGIPYSQSLTANGAKAPVTFFLAIGPMPPGLSLSDSGLISGMPTKVGQFTFKVGLIDADGCPAEALYTVFVSCPTISIAPNSLPGGTEFVSYNPQTFTASGGSAPYTFSQTAGSLPAGMTISSDGVLSGTPTSGSSTFTVTATDTNNCAASKTYTLNLIDPKPPVMVSPSSLPAGVAGRSYKSAITASGGAGGAPYSFAAPGSLPGGLTLSSAGTLSGVPSAAGVFSFTVTATDSGSNVGQTNCTINVTSIADLAVSSSLNPNHVTVDNNLTCTITVTNLGPSPATGVTVNNSLPAGASFVSASAGCTNVGGTLICNAGPLAAGASISLSYVVTPTALGAVSATATVTANEPDPKAGNNSAAASSIVNPPFTVASNPHAITDGDGDIVSVTLKGAGTMEVHLVGGSDPIDSIVLAGTDASSSLTIQVKRGPTGDGFVNIGSIVSDGSLKSITGKTLAVVGPGIQLGGSLGTLNVNALRNSSLTVGGQVKLANVRIFSASMIVATQVGSVKIGTIPDTDNGGREFGVLVEQAKGTVSVTSPQVRWKIATSPDQHLGDFHVKQ